MLMRIIAHRFVFQTSNEFFGWRHCPIKWKEKNCQVFVTGQTIPMYQVKSCLGSSGSIIRCIEQGKECILLPPIITE